MEHIRAEGQGAWNFILRHIRTPRVRHVAFKNEDLTLFCRVAATDLSSLVACEISLNDAPSTAHFENMGGPPLAGYLTALSNLPRLAYLDLDLDIDVIPTQGGIFHDLLIIGAGTKRFKFKTLRHVIARYTRFAPCSRSRRVMISSEVRHLFALNCEFPNLERLEIYTVHHPLALYTECVTTSRGKHNILSSWAAADISPR